MVKKAIFAYAIIMVCISLKGMEKDAGTELPLQRNFVSKSGEASPRLNYLRKSATSIGTLEEEGEGRLRKELSAESVLEVARSSGLMKKFLERRNSLSSLTDKSDTPKK